MSFGKSSGPPASAKQVQYLLALIQKQGHADFRDARHPLGLTQRQAAGKFSIGEASALIDTLVNGESVNGEPSDAPPAPSRLDDQRVEIVRGLPADVMAAELARRGWDVSPPD
jgi:hypothetical protein